MNFMDIGAPIDRRYGQKRERDGEWFELKVISYSHKRLHNLLYAHHPNRKKTKGPMQCMHHAQPFNVISSFIFFWWYWWYCTIYDRFDYTSFKLFDCLRSLKPLLFSFSLSLSHTHTLSLCHAVKWKKHAKKNASTPQKKMENEIYKTHLNISRNIRPEHSQR